MAVHDSSPIGVWCNHNCVSRAPIAGEASRCAHSAAVSMSAHVPPPLPDTFRVIWSQPLPTASSHAAKIAPTSARPLLTSVGRASPRRSITPGAIPPSNGASATCAALGVW